MRTLATILAPALRAPKTRPNRPGVYGMLVLFLALFLIFFHSTPASSAEFTTPARFAILIDYETGQVLFEKKADVQAPTASMSKVMTLFLLFEALRNGVVGLEDRFRVSRYASKRGGSTMFLTEGSTARIEDLIRGIVVHSGNDAAITVAEGLAGSEEAFAEIMNERAGQLGLTQSRFANATGWPDPNHYMSARDLAHLARETIRIFPEYYSYYAEKTFVYNNIKQNNRNPLLFQQEYPSDGVKTGHTEEAGYGLLFSSQMGGRRLIGIVNGLDTKVTRLREARRLLSLGFNFFSSYRLFERNQKISELDVWLGKRPVVDIVTPEPITVVIPRSQRKRMKVVLMATNPLVAPVKAGDVIAQLVVKAPELQEEFSFALVAGQDSPRPGPIERVINGLTYLVFGGEAIP